MLARRDLILARVELFRSEYVQGEPFEVASEIRETCERVMRQAQVL